MKAKEIRNLIKKQKAVLFSDKDEIVDIMPSEVKYIIELLEKRLSDEEFSNDKNFDLGYNKAIRIYSSEGTIVLEASGTSDFVRMEIREKNLVEEIIAHLLELKNEMR